MQLGQLGDWILRNKLDHILLQGIHRTLSLVFLQVFAIRINTSLPEVYIMQHLSAFVMISFMFTWVIFIYLMAACQLSWLYGNSLSSSPVSRILQRISSTIFFDQLTDTAFHFKTFTILHLALLILSFNMATSSSLSPMKWYC